MGIRGLLKSFKIDVDRLVDVAMTGLEAVKSVQSALNIGVDYHIVFTDISMPEMDGLEAARQIRDLYHQKENGCRGPHIIGITGHSHEEFVKRALAEGIDQVESKPMYRNKLEEILKQYAPNFI